MKVSKKLARWLLPLASMAVITACTGNTTPNGQTSGGDAEVSVAKLLEDPAVKLSTLSNQQFIDLFGAAPAGFDFSGEELKLSQVVADKVSATASYIWVANSDEGTISKLDTVTGQELGRYRTGPENLGADPSRTTVDKFGNVWVGNRNNNTITKVGLKENNQCIDRNNNGQIDTSTGGSDVLAWTGNWGAAVGSQVEDECIILHVKLSKSGIETNNIRAIAIDQNNTVFAAGTGSNAVYKVNSTTGEIIDAKYVLEGVDYGGHYGGVVDKEGNLWSMPGSHNNSVIKTSNDLQTSTTYNIGHSGYGITIDKFGKVWTSSLYDLKFSAFDPANPSGTLKVFDQIGQIGAQGITTNKDGDVFIAGSLFEYNTGTVGHFKQTFDNDGAFTGVTHVKTYSVAQSTAPNNINGFGPTGVAVDINGNVWTANINSNSASKITLAADPANAIVVNYPIGLGPYNYSDMTGAVFTLATSNPYGYWEPTIDSEKQGFKWKKVFWQLKEALKDGAIVKFSVKASDNYVALNNIEFIDIQSEQDISNLVGRYLRIKIYLEAKTRDESPILTQIRIY